MEKSMLWNLILIAGEPSADVSIGNQQETETVELQKEATPHKARKKHKKRHHGVSRKKLTAETDAIAHALNAGAMPLMPSKHEGSNRNIDRRLRSRV